MCGLFFYQGKGSIKRKNSHFHNASKLLVNRGPDFQKYEIHRNRKIFHSRLKIIDLNNRSSQPMSKMGYSIIYNGEIYNYLSLKKNLKSEFKFKTNSDTEVLLCSFLKWGKEMFDKIEGMYSFVIYNQNTNYFFAARDRFGQKPLYYYKNKSEICLSSEIKPIAKFLDLKLNFEDKEIYKYLNHNYFADDKYTFFKNIFQLTPGSYGEYNNKQFTLKKIKFKKFKNNTNKKEIKLKLKDSVKATLVSDVEVAVLFSGGIDSHSIYDLLPKKYKKNIKLFNLTFEDFDNKISAVKKKNYYIHKFDKENFFKTLNECSKICESPALSLFTLGYTKIFQAIKNKKIKVILNGQGIDEIFGGYNYLFKKLNKNAIYHPSGKILSLRYKNYKKGYPLNIKNKIIEKKIQLLKEIKIPKNLTQLDKLSMNYSLECRSPYLTNLLYNSAINIKNKDMLKNNLHKYIFRDVLYSITKNKFYYNKKNYEAFPQDEFLKDSKIYSKIKRIVSKKNYCDKYFKKNKIIKILKDFSTKKKYRFFNLAIYKFKFIL